MKKIVNNIIFVAAVALFALIVYRVGIDEILINLTKTGWWIVPVTAVWFVVYLFNSLAFKQVLSAHTGKVSLPKIFSLVLTGFSLNYITPVIALGGELYKINALKRYMDSASAASVAVKYYIMHVLSHVVFWILGFMLFVFSIEGGADNYKLIAFGALFIAVMIGLFVLLLKKNVFSSVFSALIKFAKPVKLQTYLQSKEQDIIEIDKQIKDFYYRSKSLFYKSMLWELSARVFASLEIYLILWSIGYEISFYQAVYFSAISSLFLNMMFFIPMQMGGREAVYYFLMQTVGISAYIGVYLSLTSRIREFIWILSGLLLIPLTKTKKSELNTESAEA